MLLADCAMGSILEIYGLTKFYDATAAIHDITLNVRKGEILVILGPSGSGKSTLLKSVAGIIEPSSGQIMLRGRDITHIAIHERNIGLVMQGYSLFPHMSAYENVAYPLRTKIHRHNSDDLRERVSRMFDLTGLVGFEKRKPNEMSGGQQQRVALARALVFDPTVLLLDEPLGALDRELRERMELEIRKIQRLLGTTVLYVTHDQGEAMRVADRIAILRNGAVEQVGTPVELYQQPASQFVAKFLGGANFLEAVIMKQADGYATVQTPVGELRAPASQDTMTGDRQTLMIRPERLHLNAFGGTYNRLSGILVDITFLGNTWQATVAVAKDILWRLYLAPEQADDILNPGKHVDLYWKVRDTQLLAPDQISSAQE
jgi:putative spermidine/putrescine transport system ATP-binding protein